jgi:hypothetical protein
MNLDTGVVYYLFGNNFPNELENSVNSIRNYNNIPIALITEQPKHAKCKLFDIVIESISKKKHGWHKRTESLLLTPFTNTLHLDTDTIITGSLDYGFSKSQLFNLALCHAPAYYAKTFFDDTSDNSIKPINDEQIIYNAGVIFYKKCETIWNMISAWIEYNEKCSTIQDQCGLSNAIESMNINPFVLSKGWNFRAGLYAEGYGPIKVWHSRQRLRSTNNKGFFRL